MKLLFAIKKKSLCICEGDTEYIVFSTEDGNELIRTEQDMVHNGDMTRTGTSTQTGNATIIGELNVNSAKGAGDINAQGNITASGSLNGASANVTGTTKTGTIDYSKERRNGLPTKSIYEVFSLPDDNLLVSNAGFANNSATTVFDLEQHNRDIIDMHNYLQENAENLTAAELTQLGVRIASGAATTFTPQKFDVSSAAPSVSNAGAAGSVTIYSGAAGVQTGTGGVATTTAPPDVSTANGSRLFVLKNITLDLASSGFTLNYGNSNDGITATRSNVFVQTAGVAASTAPSATDGDNQLVITGTGATFSGIIYVYDTAAGANGQTLKGYITTDKALTISLA
jgi:hypothetical protein